MVIHKRMTCYILNILQQKDECERYHVQNYRISAKYLDTSVYIGNKRDVADIVWSCSTAQCHTSQSTREIQ